MIFNGTLGGTIHGFNYEESKSNRSCFNIMIVVMKLSGHLSNPSVLVREKSNSTRILVSGGLDTNVKVWDVR